MEYRPEFVTALELVGRAFNEVVAMGHPRPVIVGGAAVEYYTGGAVVSGDFDIVTAAETTLVEALLNQGFRTEDRAEHLLRGYYHPDLAIAVEIVGRSLFDGNADSSRVVVVQITEASDVAMVSVEDLIADRMGQFASTSEGVKAMLDQAIKLYQFAQYIDEPYLDARIRTETLGSFDLKYLLARTGKP
jgi:hypothetical protein